MPTTTTLPYTREAAERIARHGANKMDAQGYTWKRDGFSGDAFKVTKPADEETGEAGAVYDVIINDGGRGELHSCSCPFCQFGFRQHTCKHCVWIVSEVEAETARIAEREAEFEAWEAWGKPMAEAGKF